MEYLPLVQKENIQLTHGREDTVVIAGWLSPSKIDSLIVKYGVDFCAIGNLYSQTPGVNFLVRNLLYNPQIKHLIVIESTQQDIISKSSRALVAFFEAGLTTDYSVDVVGINCDIDTEIPLDKINDLRSRITVTVVKQLQEFTYALPTEVFTECTLDRLQFPSPSKAVTPEYPDPKTGYSISAENPTQGWLKVMDYVYRFGRLTPNRFGGSTKECLGVSVTVSQDDIIYPHFCPMNDDQCDKYILDFISLSDGEDSAYTYSNRLRKYFSKDQIANAIDKLIKSPDSRGVVINLWDSVSDLNSKEPPCLNHIWLRLSQGKLYMIATFRSHDIFSAWYPNVVALRALQRLIMFKVAYVLDTPIDIGEITIISDSAHIYEHNYNQSELIIDRYCHSKETYNDSVGNFVITVKDCIKVDWLSPLGKRFYTFTGKKALTIGREIYDNIPHILPTHLLYLGVELSKAERCLNRKIKYNQDDNITE